MLHQQQRGEGRAAGRAAADGVTGRLRAAQRPRPAVHRPPAQRVGTQPGQHPVQGDRRERGGDEPGGEALERDRRGDPASEPSAFRPARCASRPEPGRCRAAHRPERAPSTAGPEVSAKNGPDPGHVGQHGTDVRRTQAPRLRVPRAGRPDHLRSGHRRIRGSPWSDPRAAVEGIRPVVATREPSWADVTGRLAVSHRVTRDPGYSGCAGESSARSSTLVRDSPIHRRCGRRSHGSGLPDRSAYETASRYSAHYIWDHHHHVVPMRDVGVHRDDRRHCWLRTQRSPRRGLYAPDFEHDACGVAMVADLAGRRDHAIVRKALTALLRLEHRGARGAEDNTGDGAGHPDPGPGRVLPRRRRLRAARRRAPTRPASRSCRPTGPAADAAVAEIDRLAAEEGLGVLGWRELPVDPDAADLGPTARAAMPSFRQLFVGRRRAGEYRHRPGAPHVLPAQAGRARHRRLLPEPVPAHHRLQGHAGRAAGRGVLPGPVRRAGHQRAGRGALPVLHQHVPGLAAGPPVPLRRAQRRDQHAARQPQLDGRRARRCWSPTSSPATCTRLVPDRHPGRERLRHLRRGARAAAPGRAVPAARGADDDPGGVGEPRRDGPGPPGLLRVPLHASWSRGTARRWSRSPTAPRSAPCSTATACARPATGSPRTASSCSPPRSACWTSSRPPVVRKGRLEPGRMFLVDTAAGRIIDDEEIKGALAAEHPYAEWLHAGLIRLGTCPTREREISTHAALTRRQQAFGYTEEELNVLLKPMAGTGAEPIGSMGNDAPLAADLGAAAAALRLLHPAVRAGHEPAAGRDPRGAGHLAAEPARARSRTCSTPAPASCRDDRLPFPVLGNDDLAKIVHINDDGDCPASPRHRARAFHGGRRRRGPARRLNEIRAEVSEAIEDGARLIVLSNRGVDAETRADPVAAAHRRGAPPPGPGAAPAPGSG